MARNNVIDLDQLFSMANFRGAAVELPVNLWIDEGKEYIRGKHSKRIKFQKDYAKKIHEWNLASMTLDGEIVDETNKNSSLSTKDEQQISNFTRNNAYALDKLADFEITDDEFKEVMIKGGELATSEQIDEQKRKVDKFIAEIEESESNIIDGDVVYD